MELAYRTIRKLEGIIRAVNRKHSEEVYDPDIVFFIAAGKLMRWEE